MSTATAAQSAIIHTGVGIAAGTFIEQVLPQHDAEESIYETLQDTVLQAALNGVLVALLTQNVLYNDDALGGGMFFTSLFAAQPLLQRRISILSGVALEYGRRATSSGLQMSG